MIRNTIKQLEESRKEAKSQRSTGEDSMGALIDKLKTMSTKGNA
jgi:hypothetical protein